LDVILILLKNQVTLVNSISTWLQVTANTHQLGAYTYVIDKLLRNYCSQKTC